MASDLVLLTAVLGGFMLLFAVIGGHLARRVRFPRVVGYLLAGLVLKVAADLAARHLWGQPDFFLVNVADPDASPLGARVLTVFRLVNHLALGLIMFTIGTVFEVHHLRSVGRRFWPLVLADNGTTFALVACGCALAAAVSGLPFPLMLGLMAGVIAMATAPAATLFVLMEYESKGPMTNHVLSMVGANNVLSIVAFNVLLVVFVAAGWLPGGAVGAHPAVNLLMLIAGSLVVGSACGAAFSWAYPRLATGQAVLLFIAIFLFLPALQARLQINGLVAALVVGVVFINLAPDPGRLERALETLGAPLFTVFFVLAGFNLHLAEFAHVPLLGVIAAYVVMRGAGKALGGWLGRRSRQVDRAVRPTIGLGLFCQAGVAIGLGAFLVSHTESLPGEAGRLVGAWARQINTIVLASVALFELTGPLLLKAVIVRSGEVKAINLLARAPVGAVESASGVGWLEALGSILRRLNLAPPRGDGGGDLTARHIMRASVKLLPAAASLDEVLQFIERSRLDHFPVIDEAGRLIGTINLADVRNILYDPELRNLVTAADLIEPTLITATADEPLDELFEKFQAQKIFAIPVVDAADPRKLIGLVEQRDLLRALHTHAVGQSQTE